MEETFENYIKSTKIKEKTWKFFQNYINKKSETFGDIVKSYHAVPYKESKTSKYRAYSLYNSPKFQKLLRLWREKEENRRENREFTALERTLAEIEDIIVESKKRKDLTNWRGAVMDFAKLNGLLIDKQQINFEQQEIFEDKLRIESRELARLRLLSGSTEEPAPQSDDVVDAAFIEEPAETEEHENQDQSESPQSDNLSWLDQ